MEVAKNTVPPLRSIANLSSPATTTPAGAVGDTVAWEELVGVMVPVTEGEGV